MKNLKELTIKESCSIAQSCLTLRDPKGCSPPGSSVHGISQARTLQWVAMSSSCGSCWHRDQTCVCYVSCTSRGILYHYEQLNVNILDNLDEMNKFLEIHTLSRLNYEEIENINGPTASKEIKSVIKTPNKYQD